MQGTQYTPNHKEKKSSEDTNSMMSKLTTQSYSNQDSVVLA